MSDMEPTGGDVAPSPAQELSALSSDAGFQADWDGSNGRPAQIEAVARKSELMKAAHGPADDPAPTLPDAIQTGLDAPDAVSQAAAEAMIPGLSVDDYKFNWQGQGDMELEQLQDMNTVASEAALALGANPHFAQQTIEFMDQQLARPDIVPVGTNTASVVEILNRRLGADAPATLDAARAAVAKLPERSRDWLFNSMDQLDANGFAWMITRLSSIHKANAPRT